MNTSLSLLERCLHVLDKEIFDNTPEQAKLMEDLEVAIAEQKDPISHYARGFTDATHRAEQAKPQEPAPLGAAMLWHCPPPASWPTETARPQALEPMSEDEIKSILISIDPMTVRVPKGILSLVRAIEAHHGIK